MTDPQDQPAQEPAAAPGPAEPAGADRPAEPPATPAEPAVPSEPAGADQPAEPPAQKAAKKAPAKAAKKAPAKAAKKAPAKKAPAKKAAKKAAAPAPSPRPADTNGSGRLAEGAKETAAQAKSTVDTARNPLTPSVPPARRSPAAMLAAGLFGLLGLLLIRRLFRARRA
jgi:hypothetical protein